MKLNAALALLLSALLIVAGPGSTLAQPANDTINLRTGDGVSRGDYNITAPNVWTFTGGVVSTLPASSVTTAAPDSGATARNVQLKLNDFVDLLDYLPVGQPDGTTDNSSGIQMMGTLLCARKANATLGTATNNGGEVYFGAMSYVAHDVQFTCGLTLHGVMNQGEPGGAAGGLLTGTKWIYSAATGYGVRFGSSSFKTLNAASYIQGVKVEGILFNTATNTANVPAIYLTGVYLAEVRDFGIQGSPNIGVEVYGFNGVDIENGNMNSINQYGIELLADASGTSNSSGSCTTTAGGCSTFGNVATIRNVPMSGNGTAGVGILISGPADTDLIDGNTSFEGGAVGLEVVCPTGFSNIGFCPEFITAVNFQAEGAASYGMLLEDFTDFQCFGCYVVANGTSANNAVSASLVNYSQAGGAGGGLRWAGGHIANAQQACGYIGVSDVVIRDAWIFDCDLAGGGAQPGIVAQAGAQQLYEGNTFCTVLGVAPPVPNYPLYIVGATQVRIIGNIATGCLGTLSGGALQLQGGSASVNALNYK